MGFSQRRASTGPTLPNRKRPSSRSTIIYRPEEYFARCLRALTLLPEQSPRLGLPLGYALRCFVRSLWKQGLRGSYRRAYWRFLAQVLRRAPKRFARAISLAVAGEHMIRYTRESVLPRLAAAIGDVEQENAFAVIDHPNVACDQVVDVAV